MATVLFLAFLAVALRSCVGILSPAISSITSKLNPSAPPTLHCLHFLPRHACTPLALLFRLIFPHISHPFGLLAPFHPYPHLPTRTTTHPPCTLILVLTIPLPLQPVVLAVASVLANVSA
ncbi:hypothetical protein M427DRAFT_135368 [Gonapodya prolifera JEL478]|uniref:Secreted protein n=1 Tax=Gonapodya prolifera (strain JEL478) TaxID=1344416 RepID=A0A139AF30_GONPJ|nr:hypothetical protein M427DRAFT_135368 [Gonapodya prolifera JEL478]|eukprot:KXS15174.1 hypothetical protein M427DRAFT_135368 [Gonapodya prolifera JEL478]